MYSLVVSPDVGQCQTPTVFGHGKLEFVFFVCLNKAGKESLDFFEICGGYPDWKSLEDVQQFWQYTHF